MSLFPASSQESNSVPELIIGMEKAALERWNQGDPSGFLEISADDVVYFDPFTEHRLDGISALTNLYEGIRGKVHVDKYEMINPRVHATENMAALTYNLVSFSGENTFRWNCTEVFRLDGGNWKIVQTHWSLTKPELK